MTVRLILFLRPDELDLDGETVQVICYGAVQIPDDETLSQSFIDEAWMSGIQVAEYDYREDDPNTWDQELFVKGAEIVAEVNQRIMAKFN